VRIEKIIVEIYYQPDARSFESSNERFRVVYRYVGMQKALDYDHVVSVDRRMNLNNLNLESRSHTRLGKRIKDT